MKQATTKDFQDPFNAGQMVGMLVILTFIEAHKGISQEMMDKIKDGCAKNAQVYLNKPTEDIYLMIENIVKDLTI